MYVGRVTLVCGAYQAEVGNGGGLAHQGFQFARLLVLSLLPLLGCGLGVLGTGLAGLGSRSVCLPVCGVADAGGPPRLA